MKKKKAKKSNKSKKTPKKRFSLAFLLSIPSNYILAGIFFLTIIQYQAKYNIDIQEWYVFSMGVLSAFGLIVSSKISKFRVFIHELKHSILVGLTGNIVKDFHVGEKTGHVQYQMYQDKVHFAPLISLAPYFFPLFSLPAVLLVIFIRELYPLQSIILLGFTLGADLTFSISEIHSHQTDFQVIVGGFFISALYLAGFYIMWSCVCAMMAIYGPGAFSTSISIAYELALKLYQN